MARSAHENKSCIIQLLGRPRTIDESITRRILDEIAWNFTPSEMMDMTEDREVWLLNLELLPPCNPHGKEGNEERRRRLSRLASLNTKILLNLTLRGTNKKIIELEEIVKVKLFSP